MLPSSPLSPFPEEDSDTGTKLQAVEVEEVALEEEKKNEDLVHDDEGETHLDAVVGIGIGTGWNPDTNPTNSSSTVVIIIIIKNIHAVLVVVLVVCHNCHDGGITDNSNEVTTTISLFFFFFFYTPNSDYE